VRPVDDARHARLEGDYALLGLEAAAHGRVVEGGWGDRHGGDVPGKKSDKESDELHFYDYNFCFSFSLSSFGSWRDWIGVPGVVLM
jgi:hypothetical protein